MLLIKLFFLKIILTIIIIVLMVPAALGGSCEDGFLKIYYIWFRPDKCEDFIEEDGPFRMIIKKYRK